MKIRFDVWNAANKPDKTSKKDREIARLTDKVVELITMVENLSAENVILHNKLIAAVGVDEAFYAYKLDDE